MEPIIYVNGAYLPESEAHVSVYDRGFRWGDAVYDVERTYNHRIFRLERHMARLFKSLKYTRIDPGLTPEQMKAITVTVLTKNLALLGENDDVEIIQVISRGVLDYRRMQGKPTVTVCCQMIHFEQFAADYLRGVHLVTPSTRRTPPQSLSPRSKISNKMNHFVADAEAKQVDPAAYSLMLDVNGYLTENAGGNAFFVSDGRLKTPSTRNILEGVTRATVIELAAELGILVEEGDYTVYDLYTADEAFLTSTPFAILPASKANGLPIGASIPGPVTRRLMQRWNEMVGVDLVEQALNHLSEAERDALQKELSGQMAS